MNHDTAAKLARLRTMQAEYQQLQAAKKKPEPKEPNEFQKRIQAYADDIMALEKIEDRREALYKIPSDCRGWVEAEVRLRFDRKRQGVKV